MKKLLTAALVLAMALSLFAGFAVTSSAAPEFLEKEYKYSDAQEEFGNEETKTNPVFCGGLWMYEWYHEVEETFGVMEAWFDKTPEGVGSSSQSNFYTPLADSHEYYGLGAGTLDDYYYCMFRYNGKGMHPGINVAPVLTFVCPADGKLSYTVKGRPNGASNIPEKNSTGNHVYVFLDEEIVFEEAAFYYTDTKETCDVDLILDVKEGQKIRYAIGPNGTRGSKGWDLTELPVVAYIESSVPIGNPAGLAPENLTIPERTDTSATVSWDAVEGAKGYNVYIGDEKQNEAPVTDTYFTITGLTPETVYEGITVTSISAADIESDRSEEKSVRTKKATASADTEKTDASVTADAADPEVSTGTVAQDPAGDSDSGSMTLILIIVAILAVVVVVAVVVILMLLKKMRQAQK